MSFVKKEFIRCDRCKATREVQPGTGDAGGLQWGAGTDGLEGWIETDRNHHLCPRCAGPYMDKKREMERELKRLAGIETIEVDI
jgi:hypothetical protein